MKTIIVLLAILGLISAFRLTKESTEVQLISDNADPTDCIKAKCPNEYDACQKDSNCPATLDKCEKKCNTDQNCWKWCLVGAGDQPAINVAKCAAANHCLGEIQQDFSTALVPVGPQECIEQKCPTQWADCQKDPKCVPALQDCEKKCGTSQSCWSFCLPSKGSQAAVDVAKCAAANKCVGEAQEQISTAIATADPTDCIKAKCPNEYDACQKDSNCPATLDKCEKKCNTDQNCWKWCLVGAGDQPAINVAKCAAANHCLGEIQEEEISTALVMMQADPTDCIKAKCPNEYDACQKDSNCPATLDKCEKKCNTDQNCWKWCLVGAGDQPAINVAKCAAANHCLGEIQQDFSTALVPVGPQECIEQKCPTQWADCQKDPKCVPALQDCEKKCGTSQSCWSFCLPSKGSQAAVDVAKCAAANKCVGEAQEQISTAIATADPTDCIKAKCPNEYDACQKDSNCPATLDKCEKKCNTDQNCWKWCLVGAGDQPAINVAKCAAANHCLGQKVYGFEVCMSKTCPQQVSGCLGDKLCRSYLLQCKIEDKIWQFDLECLKQKSAFHPQLAGFYTCAGESKCL